MTRDAVPTPIPLPSLPSMKTLNRLLPALPAALLLACSASAPTEPTGTLYWREALLEAGLGEAWRNHYPAITELDLEQAGRMLEPCLRMAEQTNCADLLLQQHADLRGEALAASWPRCLESMPARYVGELLSRSASADEEAMQAALRQPRERAANRLAIITELLAAGAPADARNERGASALHVAADQRDGALVELLLRHGADPAVADRDGRTALDIAQAQGAQDIAALLQ